MSAKYTTQWCCDMPSSVKADGGSPYPLGGYPVQLPRERGMLSVGCTGNNGHVSPLSSSILGPGAEGWR